VLAVDEQTSDEADEEAGEEGDEVGHIKRGAPRCNPWRR
jgi:hypothetical protein